tara:strand:+ start:50260 stop:51048 length:789 start_codon:yes stop_codon:yes gene_type:complete
MAYVQVNEHSMGGKFLIYGQEGSGKTNLGKQFPSPIIMRTERGVNEIGGKYLDSSSYEEARSDLIDLYNSEGMYGSKSLIIDSLTALESMVHVSFCNQKNIAELQDLGGKKMGGAYVWREAVLPIWHDLQNLLDAIQLKFSCNIVIIAHNRMKSEKLAYTESYSMEDLDMLNPKASESFRRWSDVNGFIYNKVMVRNVGDQMAKNNIGTGLGEKVIGLKRSAWYYAKTRDFSGRIDSSSIDEIPYEKDGASFFNLFDPVISK